MVVYTHKYKERTLKLLGIGFGIHDRFIEKQEYKLKTYTILAHWYNYRHPHTFRQVAAWSSNGWFLM
ncbi:Orf45 [Heliothis zea nudivirus]|uniref:Orf45 n=1 Tax=Heliothis zea nudivirus 1 TaxID=3116536 RepID=Q8JKR6_9VIRU|nr:Orf45 [Heliothis zea nudivirus]AAN04340.1 Orf45 [Heliothis zea nudivirus]